MLRKHVNSYARDQLDTLPFFSWECITIELGGRPVDLVIRDEAHMELFLKFLIGRLKTTDGRKGSAEPVIEQILKLQSKELGRSARSRQKLSPVEQDNLRREIEWKLFRSCLSKYRIMKIRQKLSFCALLRNMTIKEMFLIAILRTYQIHVA